MEELQRKQNIRRIIYSLPSLILLSILAFFLARGAVGLLNKEQTSSELSRELTEKAAALVLREEELKEDIARLRTEEGIKSEIKDRFNVTQEGEYVAVIVDDKNGTGITDENLNLPWYKRLWTAIMGDK